MGGNVFPGKNRRYSRAEYISLMAEVMPLLQRFCKYFNICPSMDNKESFGDMDIVIVPTDRFDVTNEFLQDTFNTEYVKRNGDSTSLIYKDFQIDLIRSNEAEYDFCCNYMGMGDRGNFVGKLAHQLGLKFGHDGLWYPIRLSDSHKLGDILLTLDPIEAEKFLDVVPMSRANKIEEVFQNIANSKYFNPEIFLLENNNHVARIRDRKRPNYNAFLAWCAALPPSDKYFVRNRDKSAYIDMIFSAFPHARAEYDALFARKELMEVYASKFNGDLVKEWTGLEGKELGQLMVFLKTRLTPEHVANNMSPNEVKLFVLVVLSQEIWNET